VRRRLARPGAYLAIEDAGGEPLLLPLTAPVTHVGRAATADLRIEERRISRHHAIVVRHGRTARLLDNRSANGTSLNGRPILASNLEDGDVIRIGPVVLQYTVVR
jgi:pSer/pThr/pTyr-binding forkhead associated (FHA) protein